MLLHFLDMRFSISAYGTLSLVIETSWHLLSQIPSQFDIAQNVYLTATQNFSLMIHFQISLLCFSVAFFLFFMSKNKLNSQTYIPCFSDPEHFFYICSLVYLFRLILSFSIHLSHFPSQLFFIEGS